MSTAQRRRGKSLHLELPDRPSEGLPPLVALFLIKFDVKAGYTIAWKQSVPGVELAESVEFKSLPSGLHNVDEDLVYFMHDDQHAGISAFVNRSADQWERNSLMISVGALVPLDRGRLGKSWKYADKLKELAEQLVLDPTKTAPLQQFWEENQIASDEQEESPIQPKPAQEDGGQSSDPQLSPLQSPQRFMVPRGRAVSGQSGFGAPSQGISPHHPALSLPSYLDTFGPLIYPLYKAALLRKRILILNQAPVELACNFVYDISILSNIPSSVSALLPLEPLPSRLQPLFSVGVYDIDSLSPKPRPESISKDEVTEKNPGYGWVACTTDDVLSVKTNLYDVLVTIPPSYSQQAREKAWPKIQTPEKVDIKASQRDLRRYRTLRQGVRRTAPRSRAVSPYATKRGDNTTDADDSDGEENALLTIQNTQETFDDASSTSDAKLIEPLSWSALAYSSFLWWASAGEKRADLDEEIELDSSLFRDFSEYSDTPGGQPRSRRQSSPNPMISSGLLMDGSSAAPEMAIIAYFHRLTAVILRVLAELVEKGDGDPESNEGEGVEAGPEDAVFVGSEDMVRMGLDVWSEGDRKFVEDLLEFYWGRKADVQGGSVDCCGVRIF